MQAKIAEELTKQQREENDDAKTGLKAMSKKVNGPSAPPYCSSKGTSNAGPTKRSDRLPPTGMK